MMSASAAQERGAARREARLRGAWHGGAVVAVVVAVVVVVVVVVVGRGVPVHVAGHLVDDVRQRARVHEEIVLRAVQGQGQGVGRAVGGGRQAPEQQGRQGDELDVADGVGFVAVQAPDDLPRDLRRRLRAWVWVWLKRVGERAADEGNEG